MNRSWCRLQSGRRLDLINPSPLDWEDEDLACRAGRVYRWCGDSCWPLPMPVGQHALLHLALMRMARKRDMRPMSPMEERRSLHHDSDEMFLGYDAPTPVKPVLGEAFKGLSNRMQQAIFQRYRIVYWTHEEHLEHKVADSLAAACEAFHVVGWTRQEIKSVLKNPYAPLADDPLSELYDGEPWAPWSPEVTAERFLAEMKAIDARELELKKRQGGPAEVLPQREFRETPRLL